MAEPGRGPASPLRSRLARWILVAVPLGFLGYFFVYPVVRILLRGLLPSGLGDPSRFGAALADGRVWEVAWFTLWQASVSTALTLIIALPAAHVFARYAFPGKTLLRAAVIVPFVLPTVVVGTAFLAVLGPGSPFGLSLEHTIWAILIAHVFYNYAVVVRLVGGFWAHLDPGIEEAARVLGASRWRTFRDVTLPLLRPALAAAASIVFLFTFTSFGVILILGGPRFATLEVEIYQQATTFLNLAAAAAVAIIQLVGVSAILFAYSRYQERRTVQQALSPATVTARRPRGSRQWAWVLGNLAVLGLLLGGPLAVLIERSLRTASGYGFDYYRALSESRAGTTLFVPPAEAIRNSLGFAAVAMTIALVVGLMAAAVIAYRRSTVSRWFDALIMLPLGTSAVTIGFGFLIALDAPVDIRTAPIIIPIAHALVAVPFVVRTAVPVMRSIQQRLRDAAAVLGAAPGRAWREVDLPIISRAALVGAGFAAAVSLGEFGATSFIVRRTPTLPIAIFRFLDQPGALNFGQALAMSTILMAVTAAAVLAVDRFRPPHMGDF